MPIAGRRACPPEDSGGITGYTELANWVENGCDKTQLPDGFDDIEHALNWLPPNWHPNHFDPAQAQQAARQALNDPT